MINNPSYAKKPELFHAVALQQQRLASLGLGPPLPRRKKPPPPDKRPASCVAAEARGQARRASAAPLLEQWTCRTCTLLNAGSARTCKACEAPRPSGAAPSAAGTSGSAAAVSAHSAQCSECSDDDDDAKPPPLTLAQRMGLEAVPDAALTKQEWEVIAERSKGQGRSKEPCAICLGDFTTEAQVLLSCAHVFHRACLGSWERHSKSRCCPVCRNPKPKPKPKPKPNPRPNPNPNPNQVQRARLGPQQHHRRGRRAAAAERRAQGAAQPVPLQQDQRGSARTADAGHPA